MKPFRAVVSLPLIVIACSFGLAQVSGTKTIGVDFATLKDAIDTLNTYGVGVGGVIINIPSGYNETAVGPGYLLGSTALNASTSSTRTITFQKSGAGANPILFGFTPGTSTTVDGIFKIQGTDYVTIDGIDLKENSSNTTSTQRMEWGYALTKFVGGGGDTSGCQFITIKNCTIRLTGPSNTGTIGIEAGNHSAISTSSITLINATKTHSYNKFFNNTIDSCYIGIQLGLNGSATWKDIGNEVGVGGANTITNFGGSTTQAYGVNGVQQDSVKVNNNQINGGSSGGANAQRNNIYGIYLQSGGSGEIDSNTVSVSTRTTGYYGIRTGMTGASVTINDNTVQNCTQDTTATGTYAGIYQAGGATNVFITNNTVTSDTIGNTSTGTLYGIYNSASTTNVVISGNTVTNLRGGASIIAGTGIFGLYVSNNGLGSTLSLFNNTVSGIRANLTSAVGIRYFGNGNGSTNTVYGNNVNDVSSNGTATTVFAVGISYSTSAPSTPSLAYIHNNFISDLRAPALQSLPNATGFTGENPPYSVMGIFARSTGNAVSSFSAFYNTVYMNASSSNATFGACGVLVSTNLQTDLRDNAVVNLSTPGSTAGASLAHGRIQSSSASAYRPGLGSYLQVSNNNCLYVPTAARTFVYGDSASIGAGTADASINAYKHRVDPRDLQSFSENPPFVNVVTAPYDLHINPVTPTQLEKGGTPVTSPIAVGLDYDGNARSTSFPDVGADEFTGTSADLTSPTIAYTPFNMISPTASHTLVATIIDPSGVPTSGTGLPVAYWKIGSGGVYVGATATSLGNDQYSFAFGVGAATGDTVFYFVCAQDGATSPNVGSLLFSSAGGFTANPPAAGTPPVSPYWYRIVLAPLNGSYTVGGTSPNYATMSEAFSDLNLRGVGGNVRFLLNASSLLEPSADTIRVVSDSIPTASKTVTIKPNIGIVATISGNVNGNGLFNIYSPYVIIDGDNGSGNRDLTINNTNGGTSSVNTSVIALFNGGGNFVPANVTIKNCNIVGGSSAFNSNLTFGIFLNGSGGGYNSVTINNNVITKVMTGIQFSGASGLFASDGQITNNTIGSNVNASSCFVQGVNVSYSNNLLISNNEIIGQVTGNANGGNSPLSANAGIVIQNGSTATKIRKNRIHDFYYNSNGSLGAIGIVIDPGTSTNTGATEISNNMIYNIKGDGNTEAVGTATTGTLTQGICVNSMGTAPVQIYYNTIYLSGYVLGTVASGRSFNGSSACIGIRGGSVGAGTIDIRDNILKNSQMTIDSIPNATDNQTMAIWVQAVSSTNAIFGESDYNDYTVDGNAPQIGYLGTFKNTLSAWQTATGKDAHSVSVPVTFAGANDVHLGGGSIGNVSLAGLPLTVVTTDFDGESRNPILPYMGADEIPSAPLTGTQIKTIGGVSPDYPTIKAAIRALNQQGVPAGGVMYLIRSGTYNEDSLRVSTPTANASAPVIFRPDAGATVVINVTPPSSTYNFAFSVDTTKSVTISGIPLNGNATDRNMTINALGTNGQVGIRVFGNSDNCVVKNVTISCAGLLTSTAVRGVDILRSSTTQTPDSSIVDYVYIKRAGVGIRVEGFNVTSPIVGTWIQNCSLATGAGDSIGVNGINPASTTNPVIRNNTIRNVFGTAGVSGINIGTQCAAAQVYSNSIATVRTTGTGSITNGIQVIGTQDASGGRFYNNTITDIVGVASGTGAIYGFYISAGSPTVSDTFYYNTVSLSGTGTGLRISAAMGLAYFGGTPSVVLRNNILRNTRQEGIGVNSFATAIYKAIVAAGVNSDYNDLYVAPSPDTTRATGVFFRASNSYFKYTTLGNWRFGTGLDNNSVVQDPSFVSATDLHLNPATPTNLESSGTPVSVTTDLDGQPRSASTPDIGADEGSFTPVDITAPVIAHTALPPAPTTGNRIASAIITDATGIPTGTGAPRLWHKNSTDPTYTAAAVDSVSGNVYYFAIPGRAAGTTVQYYLAAQDSASANNVGTWPPGGSGVNPPGSTAPSQVYSYLIQAPLAAGSYTIGAGGNFPTLDSAFRKLTMDGITGAVTLNLTDSVYLVPGSPRKIIKENEPEYIEVNGKKEMLIHTSPYEYEQEDKVTIALQTLAGPIVGTGPSSRITIRPAAGRNVTLTGAGTYILRLLDASYVTLDGINSGGASLSIRNTSGNALVIEGNADNNIVQNVSFASNGIGAFGLGLQNSNVDNTPDLNIIQNNVFTKGWVGVAVNGTTTSGYATGNRITQNKIRFTEADSLNQIGIYFQNAAGTLIDNNSIGTMRNFVTIGTPAGISGSGKHRNTRIWNNVINDIIHINSFDVSAAYGINITATAGETTKVAVYNNMIYGIDDQTIGNGRGSRGISFTQGINDTIAYNSVYLSGPDGFLSAALYNNFTAAPASRVWRNNIAVNARVPASSLSKTFAFISDDATSQISSNYNDLYVPQQLNSFIASAFTTTTFTYLTLLDWQTTGQDLNSVSVPVNFRSPDLHVDSTLVTSINNAGTPIAGITTDFDGQPRGVTTLDIGADEFGGIAITRDIGVIALQEVVPSGLARDNTGNAHSTALESMASDITQPVASSDLTVEGAVIQKAITDGIQFEVLADTVKFRALVRNFGTLPESTYQVRWTLDGIVQATLNNPRILAIGERDTLLLQWNNAAPGTHVLKAWTLLANDLNRVNDSTSMTIVGPATVPAGIYNNGPIITGRLSGSGVSAPAGFRWSELQVTGAEANTLLGSNDAQTSSTRFRLADDFIVPTGQTWRLDSVVTYSYQSNDQGYTTPFTSANIRIWRGSPDSAGSSVVFGDTLTNRLTTSYNSRVYRISSSTTPAPGTIPDFSRVLWQNTMSAGVTLVPGRYSVDWQMFSDLNTSHFSPTVTISNRRGNAAWNARQRATNGVWSNVIDTGNPSAAPDSAQDFPFVLVGGIGPVLTHDIGAASVVQIPSIDTLRFRATVWNFGASPESTYQVRWSIDGTVQATFGNGRILGVGDIDTMVLNWTTPSPGSHTLRAWTILGTDGNHGNDTVSLGFNVSAGWTFNNSGTGNLLNSVKTVDRNVGWVAGNAATVLRTVDGGASWRSVGTTTISGDVYAVDALDSSTAFVTTTPSTTRIYRTTNGGTTWTSVFTQTGGFIDAIKMYNATTGIALGDPVTGKWTIAKTVNGGNTWTRIATEPTAIAGEAGLNNSLSTFDTTHIWFGTTTGKVYRSTDAGVTWASSQTPMSDEIDEVAFNGPLFGVAGGHDAAARTTDGGVTWSSVNIGGTGYVLGLTTTGDDFWAAQGVNVYRSTNRGATWTTSYTGAIGTLRHVDFVRIGSITRGWTVSDIGGIASALLTPTGVKENQTEELPKIFALEQNYPNPFNPTTTLRYALPKDARVLLTIYNILGQRIVTLKDEVQSVGYYNILWNGRNEFGSQLGSGVYFYRIEARPVEGGDAFTSIKKMMFLK